MHRVDLNELRERQLEILQNVSDFCKKNNIDYWLDAGTLLGAIRHKGYIPWDDDIDIGMLRKDYDKFIKIYNQQVVNSKYQCCTIEYTPNHYYGFAKIYDTSTELYEPNKVKGRKISIYIDLFVYDNVPNESYAIRKMYKKRDSTMNWYRRRIEPNLVSGDGLRYYLGTAVRYLLQIFPKSYFKNRVINNMKTYSNIETGYVGDFSGSVQKIVCSKKIFEKFIEVEFEGRMFMAPVGYDDWLKAFYGDYMQLPPIEKRVSHHLFEAYAED